MSSFYGMSQNQKPFVFDRIYGNYKEAELAVRATVTVNSETVWVGDGVYPGRYILIEYDHNNNYSDNQSIDANYLKSKSGRKNYDSTVWMKKTDNVSIDINNVTKLKLTDFYTNAADLNSPMLAISSITFGIPTTPSVTRVTKTPKNTITISQVDHSNQSGNLTQAMSITVQSVGKAISDIYDLLYGFETSAATTRPVIDLSTLTTATINSVVKAIEYLNTTSKKEFPGLGKTANLYLSTKNSYLEHINDNRPQGITTTINNNVINLTQTADNKINYSLQTITTDELGHIINIDTATITTTIDLSIGTKPTDSSITIWGKINSIDSDIGLSATTNKATTNLWGNIHNITTNIIGSSATTNKTTTNLWGNIHNINNIIGSSTITDPGTLWSNIDNITSNISSITAAIGSTNSTTNTLWGKVSSIETDVTSISNNIGSSSDPTNTTTVWGKINRIDSVIGTTTDTSDKNTLYGKIKKIEEQEVKTYTEIFYEPQYIPPYPIEQKGISPCFQKVTNIITNSIGDTSSFVSNTNSSNAIYTLSWSNGSKTSSPSTTVTAYHNGFTYIAVYNEGYLKNRKYTVNYKEYPDNTLECDGIIENVCILYGQGEGNDIISPYYSYYKDSESNIQKIDKTKTYASMTTDNKNNTATALYLYPVIFNTYRFFRENNNKYSFSGTPTVTIEVFPQNSDINNPDSAIIQTEYTTKEDFSLKWIHSSSSSSPTKTSNSNDGYLVDNSPYKNFRLDYGMITAGDGIPQNWTTASDVENSPYTKVNANTYYTIHFTARGTKSS